jgi:DNA helicase-2/ATP-dependent DNA helicase PcrA
VEQIERYALEHNLDLLTAIGRMLDENQFATRAHAALGAFRKLMEELAEALVALPLHDGLRFVEERTGYRKMLEQENTPESEGRIENLDELASAAAEASERGESVTDFLDHAALVADADAVDERAQVSLLTLHNAKGLEFPIVFLAGLEEGLFPHSRSFNSEAMLEEERRLCYVGMTRAEKRLILTWARYRRRFGGGEQERSIASRFLGEVPANLIINLGGDDHGASQLNLTSERYEVRESARRNAFTGKTYNSVENISQFFAERGMAFSGQKPGQPPAARQPAASRSLPLAPAPPKKPARTGMTVEHPKYGTGTVVRREGEGDDAKITVSFPRYGLKKLVEKYAGLKKT